MVRHKSAVVVAMCLALACRPEPITLDGSDASDEAASETSSSPESESESTESGENESSEESSESESGDPTTDGSPECGDGQIEGREQCEGDDLQNLSCLDAGYSGGTLACDPQTCFLDFSGCGFAEQLCGNGMIDALDESCDGDDLGGSTCMDFGFVAGTLACRTPCMLEGQPIACPIACAFELSDCLVAGEASPCMNDADCPASAPLCTANACWAGDEGDPCVDSTDCSPGVACTNGECWDGSAGDPCLSDGDCSPSASQCALEHCFSGAGGSPCTSSMDCLPMFFCDGFQCTTL
jgi:hypothetical protein